MKYVPFIFAFLFLVDSTCSQGLPPIQNFSASFYNGENQNWEISQSEDNFIYVANNHSLLEYDGEQWNKYGSPNGSVVRSVTVSKNIVYTGMYMEFGYWIKDGYGNLNYNSLIEKLTDPLAEDEDFWNIITIDDWVLFQSLKRIYLYNISNDVIHSIEAETNKAEIFNLDSGIYFQKKNEGVFKIEGRESVLVTDDERIRNRNLVGLFETEEGLLYLTDDAHFYRTNSAGEIKRWETMADEKLTAINLYSSLQLQDGSFVLGTISDGMYQISAEGDLIRKINQQKGLNNNTILCIFEDKDSNVWLGHDNGLSVINLNSPFNEHIDKAGSLGVVYASLISGDYMYLGTNQGLFFTTLGTENDFQLMRGTEGQVWCLTQIGDKLFCGHNNGTYLVDQNRASLISDFRGTWNIKPIKNRPNYLLQGNYNGLSILELKDGRWKYRNSLEGFNISSRFFEFSKDDEIIVNHEYKGVFRLKVDADFETVELEEAMESNGWATSLVKFENQIIYATSNGIFKLDPNNNTMVRDTTLNDLFSTRESGLMSIMIVDERFKRLWRFGEKEMSYVSSGRFGNQPQITKITVPSFLRNNLGVNGFENLSPIGNDTYLIGTSNGYVTLDLNKISKKEHVIYLSSVSKEYFDRPSEPVRMNAVVNYKHSEDNLRFSYTVPDFDKYVEVQYQYKLDGFLEGWSSWSSSPTISFENLPFGEYEFKVRAKVGGELTQNEAVYTFKIERPWHWSITAIVAYVCILMLLLYLVHKLYKSYYRKQQERILVENKRKLKRKKIKSQKKFIQIKNEKLKQEIEAKNRELAVSTMSIIKKNEFLNAIKGQLKKAENPAQIRSVIQTIDRNINNEDDWKFFEEAFNNADKHFLRKMKEMHPDLTANDLRLCAYLRLNLSSKEIAPLLNISVRSVEVKRYRLRKKMALPHENSLVSYILDM